MHIIGLTGGIGSRKSTAAKYLNKLGFETIDFDLMTRNIEVPGEPALAEIAEAFGPKSLNPDGTMNRKYVGSVVFSDCKEKEKLDNIMKKYVDVMVMERTEDFKRRSAGITPESNPYDYLQKTVIFYDHPILFEVPYNIIPPEEVWVIDLNDELRIQRILKRDCMNKDDIIKRMNSQLSREEKLKRADYVIDNSGTKEDLYRNLDHAIASFAKRISKKNQDTVPCCNIRNS